MAIPYYTLTATIYTQDGSPLPGIVVKALLDKVDYDGGTVVPESAEATTDANGVATLTLWPNTRGSEGSIYIIQAKSADGRITYMKVGANMPEANSNLYDIATDLP